MHFRFVGNDPTNVVLTLFRGHIIVTLDFSRD